MLWIQRLWIKLQTLFRSERAGQSLNDELQFHLEQQIAENVAAGMSKEEATDASRAMLLTSCCKVELLAAIFGFF